MIETDLLDKIHDSGLTLSEVARRSDINKGHLSEISRGIRNRSIDEQARIEKVLDCGIRFWNPVLPRETK